MSRRLFTQILLLIAAAGAVAFGAVEYENWRLGRTYQAQLRQFSEDAEKRTAAITQEALAPTPPAQPEAAYSPPAPPEKHAAVISKPARRPVSLCWQDYCPCDPPQGGPDAGLCRQLKGGIPVDDEIMSAAAMMRDGRQQLQAYEH